MRKFKILIVIIFTLFFTWLLAKVFYLPDQFVEVYNFNKKTPRISSFYPWYRTSPIYQENNAHIQDLKTKLVYFDIKIPANYDQLELSTQWRGVITKFEFGLEKSPEKFDRQIATTKTQGAWNNSTKIFQVREYLLSNYFIKNNKLRAVVSLPELKEGQKIGLRELRITFTKNPPTLASLKNVARRAKGKIIH